MTSPAADTAPRRVLHVFGAMNRGGAELRTLDVVRHSDRHAFAHEFVSLSGQAGALDDEIRSLGSMVHYCRFDAGFPLRFARLVRRRRVAVVHSHVFLSSGAVLAAARLGGATRRIAHFRSTGDGHPDTRRRRAYRAAMRTLIDRFATDVVGVSAGALAEGWSPAWIRDPRCQVIYNGVAIDRYDVPGARVSVRTELGLAPTTPLVVHLARFDVVKNHPFSAAVLGRLPEMHLAMVGQTAPAVVRATRAALDAGGATQRAHLVGERTDVARWLAAADVTILPSTLEGLPGVVLESVAAGTPVVANKLSGVEEIAARTPGVTIVDVGRGPDAWASAIRDVFATTTVDRRHDLRAALRGGPFDLATATATHQALWAPRTMT